MNSLNQHGNYENMKGKFELSMGDSFENNEMLWKNYLEKKWVGRLSDKSQNY